MKYSKVIVIHILVWLFFGLLLSESISSQDSIPNLEEYKNSIKVMTLILPVFSPFIFYPSLGYERQIVRSHTIEIITSYFYHNDGMGNKTESFSIRPGYNYYFPKKTDKNPEFRVGGYLNFVNTLPDNWGKSAKKYGVGFIAGTRINISKSYKWYIDLGIGASLDYVIGKDEWFLNGNTSGWTVSPRPIFHFTRRF